MFEPRFCIDESWISEWLYAGFRDVGLHFQLFPESADLIKVYDLQCKTVVIQDSTSPFLCFSVISSHRFCIDFSLLVDLVLVQLFVEVC